MPIRVFLADDHTIVREGLRLILEAQEDITVVGQAADGQQAFDLVIKLKPDVVIMDIAMPKLNGIEAAQQIVNSRPSVKVLILSMYSSSEHISRALRAGVRGYLLKESAGKEVVDAVQTIYRGRRYLSEKISKTLVDDYAELQGAPQGKSSLMRLSPREREVLQMIAEGKATKTIAELLCLSPRTVETYRSRLMEKLEINDIASLVKFAIQHGIIPFE